MSDIKISEENENPKFIEICKPHLLRKDKIISPKLNALNEVSSDVSAISNQASYEQSGSTTVLLTEEPQRSEFASDSEYQQAMIIHMNQKEVLNNLYKTNAKVHLYKI